MDMNSTVPSHKHVYKTNVIIEVWIKSKMFYENVHFVDKACLFQGGNETFDNVI